MLRNGASLAAVAVLLAGAACRPRSPVFLVEPELDEDISLADSTAAELAACQAGCAIGNHPITPLSRAEYRELLERFARGRPEDRETALETLLFHGPQVRALLAELGAEPAGPEDTALLRRELSRTHARVWLRMVDEDGIVRGEVGGHRFPIGTKEHAHLTSSRDLPVYEVSGTVHRTGLHHLWTRI